MHSLASVKFRSARRPRAHSSRLSRSFSVLNAASFRPPSVRFAITPSSPAPSNRRNQSAAVSRSLVAGVIGTFLGAAVVELAGDFAVPACVPQARERIVRILDTLHLEEVYVSSAIVDEMSNRDDVEVIGTGGELFDESGRLSPV